MQASIDSGQESWVHEKGLPHGCREPLVAHLGQRILLATDLTAAARPAERRAMEVAEQTGAQLQILALIPPAANVIAGARRLGALMRVARRHGIDATGRVATGEPGPSVLDAAFGVDAIILGAGQWRTAAGCPCGHVVLRAPCPVLVIGAA